MTVQTGWCWLCVLVLLIYAFDCGRGFIKDDFRWIDTSRCRSVDTCLDVARDAPMGFYRPVVSLTFALNYALSGLSPWPYGLTNLALAMAIAVAVARLARTLGLTSGAAVFAAAVWMLNFHGINMAVLWISGRTSLLATLGAVLAADLAMQGRAVWAGLSLLIALLAKEEPLLLPLVLLAWRFDTRGSGNRLRIPQVLGLFLAAGIYLLMRASSGAMTPATAPAHYVPMLGQIPINALHYLDRTLTFPVALLILGATAVHRAAWRLSSVQRSVVGRGLVWAVLSFGLTVSLPIRSSLYVCLPLVGTALATAAVAESYWPAVHARRQLAITACLLSLLLVPVYWERNRQIKEETMLSSNAIELMTREIATGARHFVITPGTPGRPSVADAFGDTLSSAARLLGTDVVIDISTDAIPPRGAVWLRQSESARTEWHIERMD